MIKVRPEENAIMLCNSRTSGTAWISGEELRVLEAWANTGKETAFIGRLKRLGLITDGNENRNDMARVIREAYQCKSPLRSFAAPESLHIELTGRCNLNCPQCYKSPSPHDLPVDLLMTILQQAASMHVFQIAFGGGEPLLYPDLIRAVEQVKQYGMSCSITTSGAGLNSEKLRQLITAGINHIQISLNGSTHAIHARSRDAFDFGLRALELLSHLNVSFGINWVARMDNIDDLESLILLAKHYKANNINILRYKPAGHEKYEDVGLTEEKTKLLMQIIRNTKGISLKVDSAYSNLLCGLNRRNGFLSGCGAGRRFAALDAEGYFRPCSHIDLRERAVSLPYYWNHAEHLHRFRAIEDHINGVCASCLWLKGCRGCRAIAIEQTGQFYGSDFNCSQVKSR